MIRLTSINLRDVKPDLLPPPEREGPARVLFINCNILGLKTVAIQLKQACREHDGIDAVHIDLEASFLHRVLGKSVPNARGWDFTSYRHLRLWGVVLARWFKSGRLPLNRFDVVQVMTQDSAWAMSRVLRGSDVGYALKIDSTAVLDVEDYGFARATKTPFMAAERKMFSAADVVISDTHWANRSVHRDYGIANDRIARFTNAVDLPEVTRWNRPPTDQARPVRIAFVGNAWHRKGGDLLLKAHQRCLSDRAELHVIGNLPVADANAKNVIWHGSIPREKLLSEVLPDMDIFALPSRVDMAPWALAEAAATGLPIVGVRLAGFPEVIQEGETGLLVDVGSEQQLGEALSQLVDDPALRERMGRAALLHAAEHYDARHVFPRWLDCLIDLADRPRSVRS